MDMHNTTPNHSDYHITIQMDDRTLVRSRTLPQSQPQSQPPPPPYSPSPSHTPHVTSPFLPSTPNFESHHQFLPQHQDQVQDTVTHLHNTSHFYRSPTLPKLGDGDAAETPSLYARYHERRARRANVTCCFVGFLLLLAIALGVAGGVFHWRGKRYCVKWDDGSTSGDCKQ